MNGQEVNCDVPRCPPGVRELRCPNTLCADPFCPDYPNAVCRPETCGHCGEDYFLNGLQVDCFLSFRKRMKKLAPVSFSPHASVNQGVMQPASIGQAAHVDINNAAASIPTVPSSLNIQLNSPTIQPNEQPSININNAGSPDQMAAAAADTSGIMGVQHENGAVTIHVPSQGGVASVNIPAPGTIELPPPVNMEPVSPFTELGFADPAVNEAVVEQNRNVNLPSVLHSPIDSQTALSGVQNPNSQSTNVPVENINERNVMNRQEPVTSSNPANQNGQEPQSGFDIFGFLGPAQNEPVPIIANEPTFIPTQASSTLPSSNNPVPADTGLPDTASNPTNQIGLEPQSGFEMFGFLGLGNNEPVGTIASDPTFISTQTSSNLPSSNNPKPTETGVSNTLIDSSVKISNTQTTQEPESAFSFLGLESPSLVEVPVNNVPIADAATSTANNNNIPVDTPNQITGVSVPIDTLPSNIPLSSPIETPKVLNTVQVNGENPAPQISVESIAPQLPGMPRIQTSNIPTNINNQQSLSNPVQVPIGSAARVTTSFQAKPCLPGVMEASCIEDPCYQQTCHIPGAVCHQTGCGSCHAEWYVRDRVVDCSQPCPKNTIEAVCTNPCTFMSCPAHPNAICRMSKCQACTAEYFVNNQRVDCNLPQEPCPPGEEPQGCVCMMPLCPLDLPARCRIVGCGSSCRIEYYKMGPAGIETVDCGLYGRKRG
ncbi:uncharacterized protein LOC126815556 [Patella vulgata]|uniref:uncharacterized protein LOC126815556 n=1 Tax=Patella vulgata TaxID=6465 RepID=UPI0024A84438|nr:uncharacterized protein LOC126815556 [Patella vulgata]